MNGPRAIGAPATPATGGEHARLRRMARELEGVFLAQLFQAMRASLPQDGLLSSSPGQETFTAMLDERVASLSAQRNERGIGEALYRQLARRLEAAPANPSPAAEIAPPSGEKP